MKQPRDKEVNMMMIWIWVIICDDMIHITHIAKEWCFQLFRLLLYYNAAAVAFVCFNNIFVVFCVYYICMTYTLLYIYTCIRHVITYISYASCVF